MTSPPEPLVLLAGMNCTELLWQSLQLPVPTRPAALRGDSLDQCVTALLAELPERFALAGLSLGGIVAMALARRAPERVTRLALIATNAGAPSAEQRTGWQAGLDQLRQGRSARDLQRDLLGVLFAERRTELDDHALAMADALGSERLAQQLRLQLTRVDERPGLRKLLVPTLVLHGDRDRLCPVSRHQEIAALVPGARLVTVPGGGHLLPLERPGEVSEAISAWLAER